MKKICLLLVLLISGALLAGQSSWQFYLHTGLSQNLESEFFTSGWRSGANFGVGAEYRLKPRFGLLGALSFHQFTFDAESYADYINEPYEEVIVDGSPAAILTANANMKYTLTGNPKSRFKPYLFAGPGLFIRFIKDIEVSYYVDNETQSYTVDGHTKTAPGIAAGIGLDIEMEGVYFLVELGYVAGFIKNDSTTIIPLKVGIYIK